MISKDNKSEYRKNERRERLQFVRKLMNGLCDRQSLYGGGIDSHKWENKIEVFRGLSNSSR